MTKAKNVTGGNDLLPHPFADECPGEMDSAEFEALKLDLKTNGQQQAITLYEGKILDGRARYKALRQLDKQARTEVFKGTDEEAKQYVLSTNLQRRTLTSMQKAIVAARMCKRETNAPTQQAAAALVGCSLQSVNLAVKLLAKNNTPLIKRAERGDATRSEIEELLYDAREIQAGANARVPVAADNAQPESEDEEDLIGDVDTPAAGKGKKGKGGNVIDINDRLPKVAGKPASRPGARETPASRVVQAFKALSEQDRKAFVDMSWSWLEPAIRAAGRSVVPKTTVSAKAAAAAVEKHAAEDKAAAKAKAKAKKEKAAQKELEAKKGKRNSKAA